MTAPVDTFVPGNADYKVFEDNSKIYAATLNQSNLGANNNKFYIIQVLEQKSNGNLFFWSRWGRVGVPGQNNLMGPLDKKQAITSYEKKYKDKTKSGEYKEI